MLVLFNNRFISPTKETVVILYANRERIPGAYSSSELNGLYSPRRLHYRPQNIPLPSNSTVSNLKELHNALKEVFMITQEKRKLPLYQIT